MSVTGYLRSKRSFSLFIMAFLGTLTMSSTGAFAAPSIVSLPAYLSIEIPLVPKTINARGHHEGIANASVLDRAIIAAYQQGRVKNTAVEHNISIAQLEVQFNVTEAQIEAASAFLARDREGKVDWTAVKLASLKTLLGFKADDLRRMNDLSMRVNSISQILKMEPNISGMDEFIVKTVNAIVMPKEGEFLSVETLKTFARLTDVASKTFAGADAMSILVKATAIGIDLQRIRKTADLILHVAGLLPSESRAQFLILLIKEEMLRIGAYATWKSEDPKNADRAEAAKIAGEFLKPLLVKHPAQTRILLNELYDLQMTTGIDFYAPLLQLIEPLRKYAKEPLELQRLQRVVSQTMQEFHRTGQLLDMPRLSTSQKLPLYRQLFDIEMSLFSDDEQSETASLELKRLLVGSGRSAGDISEQDPFFAHMLSELSENQLLRVSKFVLERDPMGVAVGKVFIHALVARLKNVPAEEIEKILIPISSESYFSSKWQQIEFLFEMKRIRSIKMVDELLFKKVKRLLINANSHNSPHMDEVTQALEDYRQVVSSEKFVEWLRLSKSEVVADIQERIGMQGYPQIEKDKLLKNKLEASTVIALLDRYLNAMGSLGSESQVCNKLFYGEVREFEHNFRLRSASDARLANPETILPFERK